MIYVIIYFLIAGCVSFGLTMLKTKTDSYKRHDEYGYHDYSVVIICSIFWIVAAPVYAGYLYSQITSFQKDHT